MIYTETFPASAVEQHPAARNLVYSITSSARASTMAWYFKSSHVKWAASGCPKTIRTRRAGQACPIDQDNSANDCSADQNPPAGAIDIMQSSD
jgi:hypothetical protein